MRRIKTFYELGRIFTQFFPIKPLNSCLKPYFKKEIQVKKIMLIIFLITFPYSAEAVQLPSRMTRMANTISIFKILQLFYWKAPISPPFWRGNHKHTYHLRCSTSAKLRPQKFIILDGRVGLLEFTSCTPQGSCCSEHSPGVTTGPSRSLDGAQPWCWRSAWPHMQEMCSEHSLCWCWDKREEGRGSSKSETCEE